MSKTKSLEETEVLEGTEAEVLSQEEGQVIVHCIYKPYDNLEMIRIWKSTFLCDQDSSHRSPMQHAFNISIYPKWLNISGKKIHRFTLIFSSLPKSCKKFDLIEDIPEPGGFAVYNILRNETDVYTVEVD
jgi:hypothetical protein